MLYHLSRIGTIYQGDCGHPALHPDTLGDLFLPEIYEKNNYTDCSVLCAVIGCPDNHQDNRFG